MLDMRLLNLSLSTKNFWYSGDRTAAALNSARVIVSLYCSGRKTIILFFSDSSFCSNSLKGLGGDLVNIYLQIKYILIP